MPMSQTAVPLLPEAPSRAPQNVAWDAGARSLLEILRLHALACRSAAREDLFEACAVLAMSRAEAQGAHAQTLAGCLKQATGQRPVFLRPGSAEVSPDEAWITRAFEAVRREDEASFEFLLRSRIPEHFRRNVAFLLRSIARPATT